MLLSFLYKTLETHSVFRTQSHSVSFVLFIYFLKYKIGILKNNKLFQHRLHALPHVLFRSVTESSVITVPAGETE